MKACRSNRGDATLMRRAHPPASSYDPAFETALRKIQNLVAEGQQSADQQAAHEPGGTPAGSEAAIERILASLPVRGSVLRRRLFSKESISWQAGAGGSEESALVGLTQQLLFEARELITHDPAGAAEGLGMARLILDTLPLEGELPSGLIEDLHAETWAAEALLAVERGELARAQHRVRWARALSQEGTGDPLTEAEVEIAAGLTCWLARAPREAEAHLRRAWRVLGSVEQLDRQASVLLAIAWLLDQRGESEEAARARNALTDLAEPPEPNPQRLHQLVDLLAATDAVHVES